VTPVAREAFRGKILTLRPTERSERIDTDLSKIPILAKPPIGIATLNQRVEVDQPLVAAVEQYAQAMLFEWRRLDHPWPWGFNH